MAKSAQRNLRLPASLDQWLEEEEGRTGVSVVRTVIAGLIALRTRDLPERSLCVQVATAVDRGETDFRAATAGLKVLKGRIRYADPGKQKALDRDALKSAHLAGETPSSALSEQAQRTLQGRAGKKSEGRSG